MPLLRHRNHRRGVAAATVAALGATMLGASFSALPASANPSAVPTAANTLADVDPRTLTAPASSPPIVMDCGPGQLDLNHATVSQLQALPTPGGTSGLSKPVATNIVEGRPYLQATDLRAPAVPGITPQHVALWRARNLVCATPIFTPAPDGTSVPTAADACTSSSQADLNDRTQRSKFASLFNGPTADRIVAGWPYPSVDNSLRQAGVGPGSLKKYDGKICATPYPVRHAGIDWGFATPEDGIAVTGHGVYGAYTLTVPEGVTSGAGLWASMSEADAQIAENAGITDFTIKTPTANGHIHGAFAKPVAVTLPADPADVGPGTGDVVIHYSSVTEPMVHFGEGVVHADDGRLTVAVDDLSLVSALRIVVQGWDFVRKIMPFQEAIENMVRVVLGTGGGSPNCNPDFTGDTLTGGEKLDVTTELSYALPGEFTVPLPHCVTRHPGGKLDGKFGNNRGAVMPINAYGTVTVDNIEPSGGILASLSVLGWNSFAKSTGRKLLLPPGGTLQAHPDNLVGSFDVMTNPLDTIWPTMLYIVLENLSALMPPQAELLASAINGGDCFLKYGRSMQEQGQITGWGTAELNNITDRTRTLLDCMVDYIEHEGADTIAKKWLGTNGTDKRVMDFSVVARRLSRFVTFLKVAQVVQAFSDTVHLAAYDGTVTMKWREPEPPDPATDNNGRPVLAGCLTKTFSYDTGWFAHLDQKCQDLAYGDYGSVGTPPTCGPSDPLQNAFADWNGAVTSCRLYNVLLRNSNGVLHLVRLENGDLVAHPIAAQDEDNFKEDWPEWEWRANEFNESIDHVGSPAVNDPLTLRNFTNGNGGNWLLREANGVAWWIDENGKRHWLKDVNAQQGVAKFVLTLDPAQYASDVCPYPKDSEPPGLRVC